jgi:hypothetical protein
MSSVQSQSLSAGLSQRQSALSDSQFSSYVRKQTYRAHESLDAGLTMTTKEGDIVTLTSSSHAQMDAFRYNSKGVLQTDSGKAMVTQNQQSITLASGEDFSFSVVGELSEQELGDIEAFVKDIDKIISQMARGNMANAVEKALSMGGYDSISAYTADITYQKSYEVTSEVTAQTGTESSTPEIELLPTDESLVSTKIEPFPENGSPRKKRGNSIQNIDQFVEKLSERLNKLEEALIDKAQKPVDKLFRHHKQEAGDSQGPESDVYRALDTAQKQMEKMMDQMSGRIFKNQFASFVE